MSNALLACYEDMTSHGKAEAERRRRDVLRRAAD